MILERLRSILKIILPDSLVGYMSQLRVMTYQYKQYWSGVYNSYKEVPSTGKGYFAENLAMETKAYTQSIIYRLKSDKSIPYSLPDENTFLPLICSMALGLGTNDKLSVLELGGGMGIGFVSIRACLGDLPHLEYSIVETPLMCEGGRELFENDARVKFYTDFPDHLEGVDIVFVKSALQYFEDYKAIIRRLTAYNPKFIFLGKLSAGNNPTYVTKQKNLSRTVTPFWFLNVDEVAELMSSLGYTRIYAGVLDRAYNQANFPAEYRIGKNCNLLFSRRS